MGYLTIQELKTLGVIADIINCTDDARLQFLIDYCSALIDGYTRTDFYSHTDVTEILSGYGENILALPKRLYNLVQVKDNINNVIYSNVTLRPNKKEIYCRDDIFDNEIDNIEVTGDWGWEKVPDKIKMVLVSLCNRYFETLADSEVLKRLTGPYKSETIGDYRYDMKTTTNLVTGNVIESTGDTSLDMILDDFRISDFDIGVI